MGGGRVGRDGAFAGARPGYPPPARGHARALTSSGPAKLHTPVEEDRTGGFRLGGSPQPGKGVMDRRRSGRSPGSASRNPRSAGPGQPPSQHCAHLVEGAAFIEIVLLDDGLKLFIRHDSALTAAVAGTACRAASLASSERSEGGGRETVTVRPGCGEYSGPGRTGADPRRELDPIALSLTLRGPSSRRFARSLSPMSPMISDVSDAVARWIAPTNQAQRIRAESADKLQQGGP
jgi:hypothetical protein